jgi:hypothetical protein
MKLHQFKLQSDAKRDFYFLPGAADVYVATSICLNGRCNIEIQSEHCNEIEVIKRHFYFIEPASLAGAA